MTNGRIVSVSARCRPTAYAPIQFIEDLSMPSFSRTIAISALMGATMLATPLTAMAADSTTPASPPAQATMPQSQTAAPTPQATRETVEQRIATLHASLQITPAEETKWNGVAKAMRGNAATMDKLVADKSTKSQADMTAVEDLLTYEKFAQAHVAGLKTLTSSFETLYKAMPEAQKKNADQVFESFGHGAAAAHG
jgi:protein CpxP